MSSDLNNMQPPNKPAAKHHVVTHSNVQLSTRCTMHPVWREREGEREGGREGERERERERERDVEMPVSVSVGHAAAGIHLPQPLEQYRQYSYALSDQLTVTALHNWSQAAGSQGNAHLPMWKEKKTRATAVQNSGSSARCSISFPSPSSGTAMPGPASTTRRRLAAQSPFTIQLQLLKSQILYGYSNIYAEMSILYMYMYCMHALFSSHTRVR